MTEYVALVIHPDKVQRSTLQNYLSTMARIEFVELEHEGEALQWLETAQRKVDFVFLSWEISKRVSELVHRLRKTEQTKSSLIFIIASVEDYEWIRTIFGMNDLIDSILIKPFRPQTFIQRVKQLMKSDLSKNGSVLLVEDDPDARGIIRDYLVNFGFAHVLEASDGAAGFELLTAHGNQVSMVVSDWEMPVMNGLQLLRKIRDTPRFAALPFVMVTSQTSIEQVKAIQAAEVGVSSYILKPFDLKTFRSQMESVFQEAHKQRQADTHLIEGRTLGARGDLKGALEVLKEGIKAFPDCANLHEVKGDIYMLLAANSPTGRDENLFKAQESYTQAHKLSPMKTSLMIKSFELLTDLGKMTEAIRLMKVHLQRMGFDDDLRTRLGKIYLQNGDYGAACVELRRALNVNPANTEAQSLYQLAVALGQNKEFKKAV